MTLPAATHSHTLRWRAESPLVYRDINKNFPTICFF
jgi:hypothetical protein